jgi:hypothetical protein
MINSRVTVLLACVRVHFFFFLQMRYVLFDMSTADAAVDMLKIYTNFFCKEHTWVFKSGS